MHTKNHESESLYHLKTKLWDVNTEEEEEKKYTHSIYRKQLTLNCRNRRITFKKRKNKRIKINKMERRRRRWEKKIIKHLKNKQTKNNQYKDLLNCINYE